MALQIFETSLVNQRRMAPIQGPQPMSDQEESNITLRVLPHKTYQEFYGFGGAFTEASAGLFNQLNPEKQREILENYFAPQGNNYRICRVSIHSCDFSQGNYTYVEEDDTELKSFSIERDKETIIPFIKKAMEYAPDLKILASPWSPPAWMKTIPTMTEGGKLKPEMAPVWAGYFVKFIQAYRAEGIPVFAVTVQNEPEAKQTWESCLYTAAEEREFIKNHLGPALKEAGLGDVKIIVHDHNRDHVFERSHTILSDPEAAQYVWGAGFHWYNGDNYQNLQALQEIYPDKKLIFTEGCQEEGTHHNSWRLGERYGRNLIQDLNNGTSAWIDWNLILDTTGGPNHVYNLCSAPVLTDPEADRLFYENSYHYIQHFSRFIQPGAKRVFSVASHDHLLITAFRNPDGSLIAVVMNEGDQGEGFKLALGDQAYKEEIPAHSIRTYVAMG